MRSARWSRVFQAIFICMRGRCGCPIPPAEQCWWKRSCRPTCSGPFARSASMRLRRGGRSGGRKEETLAKRSMWRKLPRPVRIGAWALLAVIVLAVVAGGVFVASFDPNSLTPRVVAAVKQQTGRDLAIKGGINLGLSLRPTVVLHDVTLSNPPGFSRPQMASLQSLDLQLALLPLIS